MRPRLASVVGKLARLGNLAASAYPLRRRLVLLQIDGLSAGRLQQALRDGLLPRLAARLGRGNVTLKRLVTHTAPSTPVHQAAMLYGTTGDIPGFGWHDRQLARTVRMDLPPDAEALERQLERRGGPGLLNGGTSYGTIFTGQAMDTFFNVIRRSGLPDLSSPTRNLFDQLTSWLMAARALSGIGARLLPELWGALRGFVRFVCAQHTTCNEWRFLYMRPFVRAVLPITATHGAVLDILRGVPVVYVDYLAYDEFAHRRGPDAIVALDSLRAIDRFMDEIVLATESVPAYGYEIFVLSDHGQSSSVPFVRVTGESLAAFVARHACRTAASRNAEPAALRALLKAQALHFWAHTQGETIRRWLEPWFAQREHRIERRLRHVRGAQAIRVVCAGTIAHLYLGASGEPATVNQIEAHWGGLLSALVECPGIGLVLARGARGPVIFHRGERYDLDDARLDETVAARAIGARALRLHLAVAISGARAGDLVLFGAFAPAGNVAYDFEFGSHGGIHPDELDCFLIHPALTPIPLDGTVRANELYRFFRARYDCVDGPRHETCVTEDRHDHPG